MRGLALIAAGIVSVGCSQSESPGPRIGLLAPYTGSQAADGFNYERALLITEELTNDGGGLAGQQLRIVFGDTGSGGGEDWSLAQPLFEHRDMLAIVGPDNLEALAGWFRGRDDAGEILALHPAVSPASAEETTANNSVWMGPSADQMACSLAQNIYDRGARSVAIVHDASQLHGSFAAALELTFTQYFTIAPARTQVVELQQATSLEVQAGAAELRDFDPDAIVLLAQTSRAADFVRAAELSPHSAAWYLGPGLLTADLLTNVRHDNLEGAIAVEPAISTGGEVAAFAREFESRFGDTPFPRTYFYLDAAILAVLAIEKAHQAAGETPTRSQVVAEARTVTTPPGARVSWNELGTALELIRAGQEVDYQGLSGALTVAGDGKIVRTNNFAFYRVRGGRIHSAFQDVCSLSF